MYKHTIYFVSGDTADVCTNREQLAFSHQYDCVYISIKNPDGTSLLIPMSAVKYIHTEPVTG